MGKHVFSRATPRAHKVHVNPLAQLRSPFAYVSPKPAVAAVIIGESSI